MKTYLLAFSLILLLCSCSDSNNEVPPEDISTKTIVGQWKLYKMTGMMVGSERTGNEMDWQETIIFQSNNKFTKTRISIEGTVSVSGSFERYFTADESGFLLTHNEENNLINNCGPTLDELLYFDQAGDILLSGGWACDRPGLFYKRD